MCLWSVPAKKSSVKPLRIHPMQPSTPLVLKGWSKACLRPFSFRLGWLKMQMLKLHPRLTRSELLSVRARNPHFKQAPGCFVQTKIWEPQIYSVRKYPTFPMVLLEFMSFLLSLLFFSGGIENSWSTNFFILEIRYKGIPHSSSPLPLLIKQYKFLSLERMYFLIIKSFTNSGQILVISRVIYNTHGQGRRCHCFLFQIRKIWSLQKSHWIILVKLFPAMKKKRYILKY